MSHAASALEQQREQLSTYAELNFEERLSLLLESELLGRNQTKIQRLKKQAKLRMDAMPSQIIYKDGRGLKRTQMNELLTGGYLQKNTKRSYYRSDGCWEDLCCLCSGCTGL
ncbi:ATP-binding protein [Vibrio sp. PP-XX7]